MVDDGSLWDSMKRWLSQGFLLGVCHSHYGAAQFEETMGGLLKNRVYAIMDLKEVMYECMHIVSPPSLRN